MEFEFVGALAVPSNGYRWQRNGRQHELVERAGDSLRLYDPFSDEHDGLLMDFIELPEDRESLLSFADSYGCVGRTSSEWSDVSQGLQEAWRLWQAEPNAKTEPPAFDNVLGRLAEVIWAGESALWILSVDREGSQPVGVDLALARASEGLAGARLTFRQGYRETRGRQRAKIVRTGVYAVCSTLEQVLWAQLVTAALGGYEFDHCQQCGRSMRARPRRAFCSHNCRVKRGTIRKAEALRMYRTGMTAKQIAKRLDIDDLEMLNGWIEAES